MATLVPRTPAPQLACETTTGAWALHDQSPEHFTLILVYRGLHCGICKLQLQEVHRHLADFSAAGVDVIAISADPKERAIIAQAEWEIPDLRLGYGLPLTAAKDWGLYVSARRKEAETDRFFEPGQFMVRTNGELFFAAIQNMPFGRAPTADLLTWASKSIANDIPARGEIAMSAL